ncbi:hypothetical protein GIB67_007723 [Kingdonia uniflora]|uniref:Cucumisin n=1 Tax=Kingdonia uniflora TaxID=39325 RepID=A0A7J7N231_9MAGN|nr:hypothetical protein GIB67_007723 [Kingdonia uniflora]
MASPPTSLILSLLISTVIVQILSDNLHEDRKVYIVYMGALPKTEYSPLWHHHSVLQQVLESSSVEDTLIRSYKRSFNGFAAKLTGKEQQKLAGMDGVVSVFLSRTLHLQTTRSWDFIGLKEAAERVPTVESDVIVGVLDTGIWPESDSFSDEGFGPPPEKWKGACNGGEDFKCNNKIIGARFYNSDEGTNVQISARDVDGHGTHTASTAAGNKVVGASFYGLARGNARGGVPSARIAVYKVCGKEGCSESDVLAGFDDAISDGVDILSVSLGQLWATDYITDTLAIGAFHSMLKGILTSNAAGNNGPYLGSVSNVAPWMLTVAASSTDRRIIDKVILGDGTNITGNAVNAFDMERNMLPLILGEDANDYCNNYDAQICTDGCPDPNFAQGKIVFCEEYSLGDGPLNAKASAVIMAEDIYSDFSFTYPLPASLLSVRNGERIKTYINSTKNPEAKILKSEELFYTNAPVVVSFSSRGPNIIVGDILKANLTAPGVEILAAWPPVASPSEFADDKRSVKYNIISGTSMSCPHATGAAAYVKTFHPDWSPSAIKSALMTTAFPMNATKNPDEEFAYGAGQIDPMKAVHPGLIYDAYEDDYVKLLCGIGYSTDQIRLVTGDNSSCPNDFSEAPKDLNYPSMASSGVRKANFTRTVTNVGPANSTYTATINSHPKMNVSVNPNVLSFKTLKEKQSFVVMVSAEELEEDLIVSASLVWSDGFNSVRSPIVMYQSANISEV